MSIGLKFHAAAAMIKINLEYIHEQEESLEIGLCLHYLHRKLFHPHRGKMESHPRSVEARHPQRDP